MISTHNREKFLRKTFHLSFKNFDLLIHQSQHSQPAFNRITTEDWYIGHTVLLIRATFTILRKRVLSLIALFVLARYQRQQNLRLATDPVCFDRLYPRQRPSIFDLALYSKIFLMLISFPRPCELQNSRHPDSSCSTCQPSAHRTDKGRRSRCSPRPRFWCKSLLLISLSLFSNLEVICCGEPWMDECQVCPWSLSPAVMFDNSRMERAVPWMGALSHWWRYDYSEKRRFDNLRWFSRLRRPKLNRLS